MCVCVCVCVCVCMCVRACMRERVSEINSNSHCYFSTYKFHFVMLQVSRALTVLEMMVYKGQGHQRSRGSQNYTVYMY